LVATRKNERHFGFPINTRLQPGDEKRRVVSAVSTACGRRKTVETVLKILAG
jgi:hypothetical protein